MILGPMYHWAPVDNRVAILQGGLVPYARPCVHAPDGDGSRYAYPYVCLAPSPSSAWGLSGGTDRDWVPEFEWDLWQVNLAPTDTVNVLSMRGSVIGEVRVRNAIPADRVWWVASRAEDLARLPAAP